MFWKKNRTLSCKDVAHNRWIPAVGWAVGRTGGGLGLSVNGQLALEVVQNLVGGSVQTAIFGENKMSRNEEVG